MMIIIMMKIIKGIYSICHMNRRFNALYKRTYKKVEIIRGHKNAISN